MHLDIPLGGTWAAGEGCRFLVWAPDHERVYLDILSPEQREIQMEPHEAGYHFAVAPGLGPGTRYFYRPSGDKRRPDPASRSQPEGVHGPSEVIHEGFEWHDQLWDGILLEHYILYEVHVGTYTEAGTFEALIEHLDGLKDLGITALEIMPVAQFAGTRNWGYDGVYPYAVQRSYGGAHGLKRLVDECHSRGLAVVLDVVYNHLGPEGNYSAEFGPYFTPRYTTPWGQGVNFDGPLSDEVRRYWTENALRWVTEFHIDALRLDAIHAILDFSVQPFLRDLSKVVHRRAEELNRRIYLIAECDRSDPKTIQPRYQGGFGIDAVWNDSFHHALHTALTAEQGGYYIDYKGLPDLVQSFRRGFVYSGQYSPYRRRRHGATSAEIPARCFVVFSQNHDQVGNRALGERLSDLVSFEALKLAAAAVLFSPYVPLLFMGEEYADPAPFTFFVSHEDPQLVEAVRKGRREEFADFEWQDQLPDPQAEETFASARLNHALKNDGHHRVLREFYKELMRLRKSCRSLSRLSRKNQDLEVFAAREAFILRRTEDSQETATIFHFGAIPRSLQLSLTGSWKKELDSSDTRWDGPGTVVPDVIDVLGEVQIHVAPTSVLLFSRTLPSVFSVSWRWNE
ncbi:MAG: malto-oligosyltrehalose trehalohydrolase [Acidobacteria bacterium]|nr:MAG: malto-oligosyltrehalose trehalohydrolase [Acidobacteriota bacterium]